MLTAVLLWLILAVPGAAIPERAVLVAALVLPLPAVVGIGALVVRSRVVDRPARADESVELLEIAGALRAGRTLRSVVSQSSPAAERVVATGGSSAALADAVAPAFPRTGRAVAAACAILDESGGPAAPVFEELAVQAAEEENVRREVRAAVAAPVLQGLVLVGIPVVGLVRAIMTGDLVETMSRSTVHAGLVTVGMVLVLVGSAWVLAVVRRALP